MSLRVGLATPLFHPHVGGVESHVASIASGLSGRGHDVTVLTSPIGDARGDEERDGYRVRRVPQLGRLFATPITPALRAVIAAGRYDVVHSHSPPPLTSYYAATACAARGIPHVLTYHCDLEIPRPWGGVVVRAYERTLGARTIRLSRRVIATTRGYARTSRALWRAPVHVIPNPVDTKRFHPGTDGSAVRERLGLANRRVVLLVARLTHHKGVEQFIGAARHTPPDAVHLVLGTGPQEERARAHAKPFGDRVRFLGRIEPQELPAYYAACDVAALCSVSRLEAFGIAALEAMASGKPVVATDIPGVREVVRDGETGLLARPLDARDIGEKVSRLLGDLELARSFGKKGRAATEERYGLDRVVSQVERVYREALG